MKSFSSMQRDMFATAGVEIACKSSHSYHKDEYAPGRVFRVFYVVLHEFMKYLVN